MKLYRINALLIRHLYLYQRSVPRLMDIFFWPILELFLWGFLGLYLQQLNITGMNIVTIFLGALIFWNFLNQAQHSTFITFLEEIWERNLLNIFVSPLTTAEFLASTLFLSIIRIILIGIVMSFLAFVCYHLNFFSFGFYIIPFAVNLLLFGWALGLFTIGLILQWGTSAQNLAFGIVFLIQPFSAVFYPVSVLPETIRWIAYLLPPSYIFEGMREVIHTGALPLELLTTGFLINIAYIVFALWFFFFMFNKAKQSGKLMKLD